MLKDETSKAEWVKTALERFEGPLIRYAARITGDIDRARDVVQDTFLRLCATDRAKVDGHLAAWLYTVCRNRAIDVSRKERRMVALDEAHAGLGTAPDPSPSATAERRDAQNQVSVVVGTLPENQQEVIRLKFQDSMSYRQISEVMGLSVSNVGYLIHTAIKTIRQRLAAQTDLMDEA